MGADSKIEWTKHSFNPWWGCQKVSDGCRSCYAESLAKRYGHEVWGPTNHSPRRFFADEHWAEPLKWNRKAEQAGQRARVFCASMADVFEDYRILDDQRTRLWELIEQTPSLNWLLLTKRPEHMTSLTPASWRHRWPDNAWALTSVENQEWADKRIPELLKVPAMVRGLSCEPLLGPVDVSRWLGRCPSCGAPEGAYVSCSYCETYPDARGIQWVIAGGESGAKARAPHPDWFRSLRDQCQKAGVAYHFKQWGEFSPVSPVGPGETYPDSSRLVSPHGYHRLPTAGMHLGSVYMHRAGKAHAGRLLDGRTWDEVPA